MASKLASRVVALTVLMAAGLGAVQAAEKIRWEDLQQQVGKLGELRSVNVVTRDGHKHHSRELTVAGDHLILLNHQKTEDIARQDVARVEIRSRKRYAQIIGENAAISVFLPVVSVMGFASGCDAVMCIWGLLVTPPFLAYTVARAPIFLAADGVALLIPPKAFEIVN